MDEENVIMEDTILKILHFLSICLEKIAKES